MRRPTRFFVLVATLFVVTTSPPVARKGGIESSVVKVFVRSNAPDLTSPWQRQGVESATGSGAIVAGRRVLTNAHVIEDAVGIEVKRAGQSRRYPAEVAFVANDCDLALLTVADENFFDGAEPLAIGEMPSPQAPVSAFGFSVGGETISVTSGIVSRIEVSMYSHSFDDLLLAQIDAPINSGNSGGPIVAADAIVGVAVQTMEEAENVGYMIPVPIIRHFLDDVKDGSYDGFPRLGAEFQDLESEALRASLGMHPESTGALVARVDAGSPADGHLIPGDVVLRIDGQPVANDLTVLRPSVGRVHLTLPFQQRQMGQSVDVELLREGKKRAETIELTPHEFLVPGRRDEAGPQYLIFGGLVFQPLTLEYLTYFEELPPDLTMHGLYENVTTAGRRQVILLQKVLPHPVNRGYHDLVDYVVETINGAAPRDMAHLARLVDGAEGRWLRIATEDRTVVVLDLAATRAAHGEILESYGIARDRSVGLE